MSSEIPLAKKSKSAKVIGTHNGTFHCDEALAVFLLRHTTSYHDAEVKRSRDPAILNTCDIVVDVGAEYDESKQRFDHHQRGFEAVFGWGFITKLSSAGLVYKHFGKEIISNETNLPVDHDNVQILWLKLYREFIEAIDAIDNGISQYDASEIKARYRVRTDLSARVAHLNPPWNKSLAAQDMDAQFEKASTLTGSEFLARLDYYSNAWLPARELLVAAIQRSKNEIDSSGRIILLESFLPWKEHLFDLESETTTMNSAATYVIYPDDNSGDWRVQAVSVEPESFESRKALPEKWRGLRDDVLSERTGIAGGVFVHASGFIGGNRTKDGALQMAKIALEL